MPTCANRGGDKDGFTSERWVPCVTIRLLSLTTMELSLVGDVILSVLSCVTKRHKQSSDAPSVTTALYPRTTLADVGRFNASCFWSVCPHHTYCLTLPALP